MTERQKQRVNKLLGDLEPPEAEDIPADVLDYCELIGFEADPWQADVLTLLSQNDREVSLMLNVTRRGGKTSILALSAVYHLFTGTNRTVVIVAPSEKQAKILLDEAKRFYKAAPLIKTVSESALRLRLKGNRNLIALSSKEETSRGLTATMLLCDEAARCPDSLIISCLPFVTTAHAAKVALSSTPRGQRGIFYRLWKDPNSGYEKIKISADDCPRINPAFIERMRLEMGARWVQAEYYNSFETNEYGLFRVEAVEKAISDDIEPLEIEFDDEDFEIDLLEED